MAFGHIEPDGYPRAEEKGPPDLQCLSKANDRDFEQQVAQAKARAARMKQLGESGGE